MRGGLDSRPNAEPAGTESSQSGTESGQSGVESGQGGVEDEPVAMDVTADITVEDMEDFDSF